MAKLDSGEYVEYTFLMADTDVVYFTDPASYEGTFYPCREMTLFSDFHYSYAFSYESSTRQFTYDKNKYRGVIKAWILFSAVVDPSTKYMISYKYWGMDMHDSCTDQFFRFEYTASDHSNELTKDNYGTKQIFLLTEMKIVALDTAFFTEG